MKIAHLSDTHLGYRALSRSTDFGWNQREFDVMETFRGCLNAILERDPDLVIHSGDLFHMVRPSNATIVAAFREMSKFQMARRGRPFVLIGGNHDTPRLVESGNILRLFAGIPGLHIAFVEAESIDLAEIDAEVLAIPSFSVRSKDIDWVPQRGRKHPVLTIHGLAYQAMPSEEGEFDVEATRHERWSYVALGDFHKHIPYGANICYAGSTDYTSSNIWEEISMPKGWVLFDTEVGKIELIPCLHRTAIDLPTIDAKDLSAEEVGARLDAAANWDDEMPLVRQKVVNLMPEIRMKLPVDALRSIQARALDYRLFAIPPETKTVLTAEGGRGRPLEETWTAHADDAKLPHGVSRTDLKTLGLELLQEVKELEVAPTEA